MFTCPYCREGNAPEEVFGARIHRFADMWFACSTENEEISTKDEIIAMPEPVSRLLPQAVTDQMRVSEILNAQP